MRRRRVSPLPVAVVVGFDLSVGLVFGSSALAAEALLQASDSTITIRSASIRIAAFAFSALWWYLITTLAFDSISRFATERERLLRDLIAWQTLQVQEEHVEAELRSSVAAELDESVARTRTIALAAIDERKESQGDLADQLRGLAEKSVRSLSHELMDRAQAEYPRSGLASSARSVVRENRFASFSMAIVIALVFLPITATSLGPGPGLVTALVFGAIAGLLLHGADTLMERRGFDSRWTSAVTVVVILTLTLLAVFALSDSGNSSGLPGSLPATSEVVAIVVFIFVGMVVTSLARALFENRARVLGRLRIDTDEEQARQIAVADRLAAASRKVASELHGSLQTKLMACAGAIDESTRSEDAQAMQEALSRTLDVLAQPLAEHPTGDVETVELSDAVASCAGAWQGLLDIESSVASELRSTTQYSNSCAVIIEEALANSYRHGNARHVEVRVFQRNGSIVVEVDDDGSGPGVQRPGLGMRRMTSIADVALESSEQGARLTALLRDSPVDESQL